MALPKHVRLEFVTPERTICHDDVDEVVLPGEEGDFGVLPGHAPMLALLRIGPMWFRKGTDKQYAFLAGGFAEVTSELVSVLAEVAERAEDIDLARAEAAKHRAEQTMAKPPTEPDYELARIALMRAISRLEVSKHARTRARS
jgi:F-type H+-transporting ATPase subunit epsilon